MAVRGRTRLWIASAATAAIVLPLGWFWQQSLLPDSYDMAAMGVADWGGGPVDDHAAMDGMEGTAVADLTADLDATPDVSETLTVRVEAGDYTVNGTSPGPLLEVTEGDLVEVTLVNDNVQDGITLHWHGFDVPNAADGVAGVTQDAVLPGESFVYRFVAEQVGTFWYHSHQVSHEQVQGGLLGGIVIHPADAGTARADVDEVAIVHRYDGGSTINGELGTSTLDAQPGDEVRLRVVNTDNGLAQAWVTGAPFRVLAIDGSEVNEPGDLEHTAVRVPAGGRVDLGFTVPDSDLRVDFSAGTTLLVGATPAGARPERPHETFDPLSYGAPVADLGFDPAQPDRTFDYRIGRRPGFLDGHPGNWWTVNGRLFPDTPMYMVEEGDVVVFRIENGSSDTHPMHLHGHHAVVLSRDGVAATGSPWWVDSLEVEVGESYEVAFVADNPGLWMDHCHNLPHAAEGLVAHLMYAGVTSSYRIGGEPGNAPE